MPKQKSLNDKNVPFEKSFKRLEEILTQLENESGEISLDETINLYQEGLKLLKICRKKIEEAELKIEKINTEDVN